MAVTREAIVICLDVGPHMRIRDDEGSPTALELATECISWILQRKVCFVQFLKFLGSDFEIF